MTTNVQFQMKNDLQGAGLALQEQSIDTHFRPHDPGVVSPIPHSPVATSKLTVIIPCFNEAATVVELLRRVRLALPDSQIIIVDDASTDGSDTLIHSVATEQNVEPIYCKTNGGKGSAFRLGLSHANRDYIVIQDADLEYDPNDIHKLLACAIDGDFDAVYGSRYLESGRKGALANYVAVHFIALLIRLRFRRTITDPCTCYKLFRRSIVEQFNLQTSGFEVCQELNFGVLTKPNNRYPERPVG